VGEVWLASGQSNMDFKLKNSFHQKQILQDSIDPNISLLSLDGKVSTSNRHFTTEELDLYNASEFFQTTKWQKANSKNLKDFSAIAYAYAFNLSKKLKVPIGIICNAVGGSPTQSWISRKTLEKKHITIDLLNDIHLNPQVDPWVNERRNLNMLHSKKHKVLARHPFDPTFLFDSSIYPLKNFPIKGVLWYQGESNAENIALHQVLFNQLVQDWRTHWSNPKMPFYFVQLSSIQRSTWGEFRDHQRKLLTIPHTGMAVSLDVGHPTNVHPTKKWVIGKRLAQIALHKTYQYKLPYSGPLFDFVNVKNNTLEVHFTHHNGLKTNDNKPLQDIFIAGKNKKFYPATSKIKYNTLILSHPKVPNPRYVKYGYTPYSSGNLTNKYLLPASTFSNF
jgi:sialate O-acetylesterase